MSNFHLSEAQREQLTRLAVDTICEDVEQNQDYLVDIVESYVKGMGMLTIERDSAGEFLVTIREPGTGTRKRTFRAFGRDQVFECVDHYFRPQGMDPHINGRHDEICPLCMGK